MTFGEAAEKILREASGPLHYRTLTALATARGFLETLGKTPEATMAAVLSGSAKESNGQFVRSAAGVYGLREWVDQGLLVSEGDTRRSLTPHFPSYQEVRLLLVVWTGLEIGAVPRLLSALWEHTGTPQANEDWTEPDKWIAERLSGEARELAERTWQRTNHSVNPRYCRGHWYFCRTHKLLADRGDGFLAPTEAAERFLGPAPAEVERQIDRWEGLLFLLGSLGASGGATPSGLLEPWMGFLAQETRINSEGTARSYLSDRLRNLVERGLARQLGRSYELSETGLQHIEGAQGAYTQSVEPEAASKIRRVIQDERERTRREMRELLHEMDPIAFERLVKQLLEAMGYTDVEVTKPSNDKGVDVKARIELGITGVNEVVQAKRTRANVQRPVLDQLRGSLHRFSAVRGTIITTAGFAKGASEAAFEPGAAPITLIDGKKLVDLLIENDIGSKRTKFELLTLDPAVFIGSDGED